MRLSDYEEGQTKELTTQYDAANSFYNKAYTRRQGKYILLESYGLPVLLAEPDPENIHLPKFYRVDAGEPASNTTARHMREFIRQAGGARMTKKQLQQIQVF